jgi:hypothetical protein
MAVDLATGLLRRDREESQMKYLLAYVLGIPGGLILLWFIFNHA